MKTKNSQQMLDYQKYEIDEDICYFKPKREVFEKSFAQEIKESLSKNPRYLNPKFFYDEAGSQIFEEICELPEYYLTRVETSLLKTIGSELKSKLDSEVSLVELGSGSSTKTRLLLDILSQNQSIVHYFPIDISDILTDSAKQLQNDFSNIKITGIIDTYQSGLEFLNELDDKQNLIAFLGSSFGNFSHKEGLEFLLTIHHAMKANDLFLIGLDLVKEKKVLENAYNDSKGVTAKFNLNILSRINSELGGNFLISNFDHHSIYNTDKQRIEMYLRANNKQKIIIPKANLTLELKKGELIHTESSHKYTIPQIKNIMNEANFKIQKIWTDSEQNYALVLCSKN